MSGSETSFSPEALASIASAVVKALPAPRRERHSWVAIASLVLATVVFISGGVGVWVATTNKTTALDIRVTAVETTVVKNGTRIDQLEAGRQTSVNSATQLGDLKESFEQFKVQNREDWRDMKLQVQDLQAQLRTAGHK